MMKKSLALLFISFLFLIPVYSQQLKFDAGLNAGLTYGDLGEYIYSSGERFIISYLQWEEKPVYFLGFEGGVQYKDFGVSTDVKFDLPGNCGHLYDSDWNSNGLKTIYSIHDNNLIWGIDAIISFFYDFTPANNFTITPEFQVEYEFVKFQSAIGTQWNGSGSSDSTDDDVSWDDPLAKKNGASRIGYYRHTGFLFTGLKFRYDFTPDFSVMSGFYIAPFIYTSALDHHFDDRPGKDAGYYMQHIQYSFFNRIKADIQTVFKIDSDNSFSIKAQIVYGPKTKGHMNTTKFTGRYLRVGQKTAADVFTVDISIGYKYYIN